jgi:hypothetical protein
VTGALHVLPVDDLREHPASKDCWCHPTEDEETPGLWIHHSMDRREEYEEGRLMS